MKPRIEIVIVDVDNTLLDWGRAWACAVRPMIARLAEAAGWPPERAEREIARVHAAWRATDCPACLGALGTACPEGLRDRIVGDFEADFVAARPLYDGAVTTLTALRDAGARVVACTESPKAFALRRLALVGLDGVLDAVYARADIDQWQPCAPWDGAGRGIALDPRELKPEPAAILRILADERVEPRRAVYIGDNLVKDIRMANAAGVHAAWARYGTTRSAEDQQLLQRLCHWTQEAGENERLAGEAARPDVVLDRIADVLVSFTFTSRR